MTADARAGLALLAVSMGLVLASFVPHAEPARTGQIVLIPADLSVGTTGGPAPGSLRIARCRPTSDGLAVTGHVTPTGAVTVIGVGPADPAGAGVAVAAADARGAQLLADAVAGDFVVTLPWASPAAEFALVDADSLGGQEVVPVAGPTIRCPDGADGG